MWRGTRRRVLGLLAVGLLAAAAGLALHAAGALHWLERPSIDARFSLRGRQRAPSDVVVVGLDNDSLAQLPRFPFSRKLHAHVLENLHAAGARLIVYDISFDRETTSAADEALFDAARRASPVVFATSLISPTGATLVLGGNANLASIGDQAAAADLIPDPDGVLRHMLDQVSGLPTIAAAAARVLTGRPADARQLRGGWIDFPGPPGTIRHLSFVRVLHDRFNPALVRGKVVVVGATASVQQDLHSTSAGGPMSGPEVQASAIATALGGFPLRSPSGAITALSIVALALLVPLLGLRLETLGVTLLGIGALALWTVATQLAFDAGAVLDYSDPLAALLLGTGATVLLGMRADADERRRLRLQFAAGQSGLVEQVLREPGERRLEPTAIIAGYRIERVIARGGMGVVYRATQLGLDRPVAIQLIATEHAQDPVYRERFTAESRIAASIEHPNVIPVYEAGEDDGLLFIAMRLVEGVDLDQLLSGTGPLDPVSAAQLITQIAGALDAAHARGLVHRDVKPANILLTLEQPEHAYLTDFGVAKRVGALNRVTRAGLWVGTLDYLAPEQIRGEEVDASADIYALAGVLYSCLCAQTPYPRESDAATMLAHLSEPAPIASALRADLPAQLDAVIAKGMAKDPAARYESAGALARACAEALGIAVDAVDGDAQPVAEQGAGERGPLLGDTAPTALSD